MSEQEKVLGEGYYCFVCARFVPKELKVDHAQDHKMGKYTLIRGWKSEGYLT